LVIAKEDRDLNENDTYIDPECEEFDDTFMHRYTIRGQKEKQKEIEKEKKQQKALNPNLENNPDIVNPLQNNQKDVKEIVEFWDANGFGFFNVNAKQQLLSWLDDSSFLQPKDMILKAMNIACANNKRKLNYIVGILKNWQNESLLTVEEIDSYHVNQKPVYNHRQATESFSAGEQFQVDLYSILQQVSSDEYC
jgi:DnaD/phage-associated family protein